MTRLLAVAISLLLASCSGRTTTAHDELMDTIERQVRLPTGARQLEEYSRYYAEGEEGRVTAVYLIPFSTEPAADEGCAELNADGSSTTVPCPPMDLPWQIPAGDRRWLEDEKDLPYINDGGCSQVTVIFDKATSTISSVECNGGA